MIPESDFNKLFNDAGLSGYSHLYGKFSRYCELLSEWGKVMNLTAIKEDSEVAEKHFADSLIPLILTKIPQNARMVDVGTGAGFPGIPMKLAREDIDLTLLDSLQKRLKFLETVCDELSVKAQMYHSRAEDAGQEKGKRESYDVAVSRAVAALPTLVEYCLPLVKVGGRMIALKGSSGRDELRESERAIELCGGKLVQAVDYSLPSSDKRLLIVIEKIKATPAAYPRIAAKIKKNPL